MSLRGGPILGFLTDWLDPAYERVILQGALAAARERNAKLVCFVSTAPGGEAAANTPIYELIGPECVDGLVVAAPSLGWTTAEQRERALGQLGLPMCSVALDVPGASSIAVDNDSGLTSAVQHLIRDHGYRRLAFVRGPEYNVEAERRLSVFRRTLGEGGVAVDERLILPGDFTVPGGARAVEVLLRERKVSIADVDAIVAANDGLALGVLERLDAHGIRVPNHVALTGFDDIPDSSYLRAPLTTVRQPLGDQGREAIRLLLDQIRGGAPTRQVLRTELVVRRSCGCFGGLDRVSFAAAGLGARGFSFDAALVGRRQIVLAELMRAGRGALAMLGRGWESALLTAVTEELKGRSPDAFREAIDDMLRRLVDAGHDPEVFHEIVSTLWRHLIPCAANDSEARSTLEAMLDEARLATGAATSRALGAGRLRQQSATQALVEACAGLCTAFARHRIAAVLEARCSALGISRLEIALYPERKPGDNAVHVLSYAGGKAALKASPINVKRLPRDVQQADDAPPVLFVLPLQFETEVLGVVAMDLDSSTDVRIELLREALSAAIKGTELRERAGG